MFFDPENVPENACWGGVLKGDTSQCDAAFVIGKAHFKNKFCVSCRGQGIRIEANRARVVAPTSSSPLRNELTQGFWSRDANLGLCRLINQTAPCTGSPLLLSRGEAPPPDGESLLRVPPDFVDEHGTITLVVSKGTLVPITRAAAAGVAYAPPLQAQKRSLEAMASPASGTPTWAGMAMLHRDQSASSSDVDATSQAASHTPPPLSTPPESSSSPVLSAACADPAFAQPLYGGTGAQADFLSMVGLDDDGSSPTCGGAFGLGAAGVFGAGVGPSCPMASAPPPVPRGAPPHDALAEIVTGIAHVRELSLHLLSRADSGLSMEQRNSLAAMCDGHAHNIGQVARWASDAAARVVHPQPTMGASFPVQQPFGVCPSVGLGLSSNRTEPFLAMHLAAGTPPPLPPPPLAPPPPFYGLGGLVGSGRAARGMTPVDLGGAGMLGTLPRGFGTSGVPMLAPSPTVPSSAPTTAASSMPPSMPPSPPGTPPLTRRGVVEEKRRLAAEAKEKEKTAQTPVKILGYPQRFAVGSSVYVQRSSGLESLGFVIDFDATTGWYEIELEYPGSDLFKMCSEDGLRARAPVASSDSNRAPNLTFPIGGQVYVKRSDGTESVGLVVSYNHASRLYLLELEHEGSGRFKQANEQILRHCGTTDQKPSTPITPVKSWAMSTQLALSETVRMTCPSVNSAEAAGWRRRSSSPGVTRTTVVGTQTADSPTRTVAVATQTATVATADVGTSPHAITKAVRHGAILASSGIPRQQVGAVLILLLAALSFANGAVFFRI